MRRHVENGGLTVNTIAGSRAVFFGFDLSDEARDGCLGIALHREDLTAQKSRWLSGFKTFKSQVPAPALTAIYQTEAQPIQAMWWGDYTTEPGHRYRYTAVPRYGAPGKLTSRDSISATVDITTNDPSTGVHGVYFNRGVAASQAYSWSRDPLVQLAVGAIGTPDSLSGWAAENLTGFNHHVEYLHTKILLLGPLSRTPTTISGSANFSTASTTGNDENMLVITGDTDVADVYFTEYNRVFDHFYARWWAQRLTRRAPDAHDYLTEDASWQEPYWQRGNRKYAKRLLYSGNDGNGGPTSPDRD